MTLALIFDQPLRGESKFGPYYLYAVADPDSGNEYSFFAPVEVHEQLKDFGKGEVFTLTKTAAQKGKKLVTDYVVEIMTDQGEPSFPPPFEAPKANGNGTHPSQSNGSGNSKHTNGNGKQDTSATDVLFNAMLISYQDAIRIQEKLNGMCDVNRIAITLFIARSKTNGNGMYAG